MDITEGNFLPRADLCQPVGKFCTNEGNAITVGFLGATQPDDPLPNRAQKHRPVLSAIWKAEAGGTQFKTCLLSETPILKLKIGMDIFQW